jgi:hypothetical protein
MQPMIRYLHFSKAAMTTLTLVNSDDSKIFSRSATSYKNMYLIFIGYITSINYLSNSTVASHNKSCPLQHPLHQHQHHYHQQLHQHRLQQRQLQPPTCR